MMKTLMMLSAVAALMLGGSAYAADVNDPTVQIKASQSSYKLAPAEFDAYASAGYRLDDGNAIKFDHSGRKYWARMNNGNRIELYAVQQGVFMTDTGARIEFQDDGDTLVIDNYERLPNPLAVHATQVRMIAAR